ncbi:MAG: hypothetical protein V1927_07205 [Candidatus Omnitrophota bacterium]
MRVKVKGKSKKAKPQVKSKNFTFLPALFTFSFLLFLLITLYSLLFTISGCAPTYPKERFKESILKVCKKEYSLDVKADTIGKTIVIYVPLGGLLDFNFGITKKASEEINNVILSVSRVALSSDAEFDFYCVIAHDVKIPEIQIVIIKSVDDVKRFMLNDISRGEYSKRMLVDIRLNPQAQKEKAIKEVFQKMSLDRHWQEDVLNDFFRAEPTILGDIGYWNGRFYVKDVGLPEFLAEQTANRVRMAFREVKLLDDLFFIKSAKGYYNAKPEKKYFRFEITAEPKWLKEAGGEEVSGRVFEETIKTASHVLHGYRFEDFDHIEILNQSDGSVLKVSKDSLEEFRKKKMIFEDILTESQNE